MHLIPTPSRLLATIQLLSVYDTSSFNLISFLSSRYQVIYVKLFNQKCLIYEFPSLNYFDMMATVGFQGRAEVEGVECHTSNVVQKLLVIF